MATLNAHTVPINSSAEDAAPWEASRQSSEATRVVIAMARHLRTGRISISALDSTVLTESRNERNCFIVSSVDRKTKQTEAMLSKSASSGVFLRSKIPNTELSKRTATARKRRFMLQAKEELDHIEQLADFLDNHHQDNDESCNCCHKGLFFPSGALQQNIQNRNQDPDGGDFKDQIYIHIRPRL